MYIAIYFSESQQLQYSARQNTSQGFGARKLKKLRDTKVKVNYEERYMHKHTLVAFTKAFTNTPAFVSSNMTISV